MKSPPFFGRFGIIQKYTPQPSASARNPRSPGCNSSQTKKTMKTTVIYHSADFDGIFCREIARKFLPGAELIGWNFGQPLIPFPTEGQVYLLDLPPDCFKLTSDLFPLRADGGYDNGYRLIWIDHHKSSIERHHSFYAGYRIDGVAACRIAWQWFTHKFSSNPLPSKQNFIDRQVTEPYAVRLAGEYDIWDKRDPNAELFQMGLRSRALDDAAWRHLLGTAEDPDDDKLVLDLLDAGESVQFYARDQNESIIKSAGFDLDFEGLHFLACNHAQYNSLLFTAGLKLEHDACLGFAWRGGKWTVSLYHAPGKEHHDLSRIAVKHGGGGHAGAAGFVCSELPFPLTARVVSR